jgi:hypothetical protein
VAFFGAFRMGESIYCPEETLLWRDDKIYEGRALILIKSSKKNL